MRDFVIVASRPVSLQMLRYVPKEAFILAADAGWQNAKAIGLSPHLVLGDFDSSQKPDLNCETIVLPAEKNDTDTHFAAKVALERGASSVIILGGLGGRVDHMLSNLQTLHFLAQNGVQNLLADENTQIRCMVPGMLELEPVDGVYLSVFPFNGTAKGVTLEGLKYPLNRYMLTASESTGTSNEFTKETARITLEEGSLMVVLSKKDSNPGVYASPLQSEKE